MEDRDMEMVDTPNAFIQTDAEADRDTKMIMKMHGTLMEMPEEIDESPTTTVLTTPFVPIPAEGLKSNFIYLQ